MFNLIPEFSFGDNVRPSQVTPALRERLVGQHIRVRNKAILAVIGTALLLDLGLGIGIVTSSEPLPWRSVFAWEAAAMSAILFPIWIWHSRRIAFLREASVIAAAVMESDTSNLPIGGDWDSWWLRSSPRNTAEALEAGRANS